VATSPLEREQAFAYSSSAMPLSLWALSEATRLCGGQVRLFIMMSQLSYLRPLKVYLGSKYQTGFCFWGQRGRELASTGLLGAAWFMCCLISSSAPLCETDSIIAFL